MPVDAAATGKRVLVVGAGPSGLSAAYHLTRLGHSVTIKDAGAEPGGMMRYGIPKYRLPRDILDAEVNRVLDMGVTLEFNTKVTDILAELNEAAGGRARRARASTPPSWPSARTSAAGLTSRPATRPGSWTRCHCCMAWKTAHRPCSAAGSPSTAAGTPPWMRPARPAARRERSRRGLPPHSRPDARA